MYILHVMKEAGTEGMHVYISLQFPLHPFPLSY